MSNILRTSARLSLATLHLDESGDSQQVESGVAEAAEAMASDDSQDDDPTPKRSRRSDSPKNVVDSLVTPTGDPTGVAASPPNAMSNVNVPQALAQPATPNSARRQHLESLDKDTLIQMLEVADDTHRNLSECNEELKDSLDECQRRLHAQFFLGDETFSPASLNLDHPLDIFVNSEREMVRAVFHYNLPNLAHLGEVPNQFFHGVVRVRGKQAGKSLGLNRCSQGVNAFASVPKKFTLATGTPISVSIGAPYGGRKLVLNADATDFLLTGETDSDAIVVTGEIAEAFAVAASQALDRNLVQQGKPARPPVGRVSGRGPEAQLVAVSDPARVQQSQTADPRNPLEDFDAYFRYGYFSNDKREIFGEFMQAWTCKNPSPGCLTKPLLEKAKEDPTKENLYALMRSASDSDPNDFTKAAILNRFKRRLVEPDISDENLHDHPFVKLLESRILWRLEQRTDIVEARKVPRSLKPGSTPQP